MEQVETRFTTDLFFVNSPEALEKVREFSPQVEEFDAMLAASIAPEVLETLKELRSVDRMAYVSMLREVVRNNYRRLRAAWIMVPEAPTAEDLVHYVHSHGWAHDREFGDGSFCSCEITFFLYDMIWVCAGTDTKEWMAVRDRSGPSLTKGHFESRFKETRIKRLYKSPATAFGNCVFSPVALEGGK